jgi:hypothetical protein
MRCGFSPPLRQCSRSPTRTRAPRPRPLSPGRTHVAPCWVQRRTVAAETPSARAATRKLRARRLSRECGARRSRQPRLPGRRIYATGATCGCCVIGSRCIARAPQGCGLSATDCRRRQRRITTMTLADLSNTQFSCLVLICLVAGYFVLWVQALKEGDVETPRPSVDSRPPRLVVISSNDSATSPQQIAAVADALTTNANHETATYRSRPSRRTGSGDAVKTAQKIARSRLRLMPPRVRLSRSRADLSIPPHRPGA